MIYISILKIIMSILLTTKLQFILLKYKNNLFNLLIFIHIIKVILRIYIYIITYFIRSILSNQVLYKN